MLEFVYNIPFLFLEPPNLKLKRISIPVPSAKTIFFVVLLSYFLVCAGELDIVFTCPLTKLTQNLSGIIYDIIVEPPSIGSTMENGHSKPVSSYQRPRCKTLIFPLQVAFLPYRVNGQYIMEGLASSFLFTIGGLGFIILDLAGDGKPKLNKLLLTSLGFIFVIVSFFTTWVFMRMKLPGYLQA